MTENENYLPLTREGGTPPERQPGLWSGLMICRLPRLPTIRLFARPLWNHLPDIFWSLPGSSSEIFSLHLESCPVCGGGVPTAWLGESLRSYEA